MKGLVNLVYHFAIPKVENWRFFGGQIFTVTLPFRNGLQHRHSSYKRLNDMNFTALCRIFVRFAPVTPEFMLLKIQLLPRYGKKSAYHSK